MPHAVQKPLAHLALGTLLLVLAATALGCATTPDILGPDGKKVPGSLSRLVELDINGRKEWVSLRAADPQSPVLIFLAGGPGGTDLSATRRTLAELERHFVVVGWDQPGAGKSYGAIAHESLSLEVYLSDASRLIDLMRKRFGKEKVFLLGESWGSFLAIRLAQRRPDAIEAVFGTGQMVAFEENDKACYDLMLAWAREKGDEAKVLKLERQGPPPYYGSGVAKKLSAFLMDTWPYMREKSGVPRSGDTIGDIFSPEYGCLDRVHYLTGILETLDAFYPQLWKEDLRISTPSLEVPAFFLLGRHDINASIPLFQHYFSLLSAPRKEVVWFENSGHNPWSSEGARFCAELLRLAGVR